MTMENKGYSETTPSTSMPMTLQAAQTVIPDPNVLVSVLKYFIE